jgi:transcriptional regulator with XRE-family HTH domain
LTAQNKLALVLHRARQDRGLSLREVQKLSDNKITSVYVNNIEIHGMIPSPKKLRVLATIYKLDFLELMIIAGHVTAIEAGKESGGE